MRKNWLMTLLLMLCVVLIYLIWHILASDLKDTYTAEQSDLLIKNRLDTLRMMELQFHDSHGRYAGNFKELFDYIKSGTLNQDSSSSTPPVGAFMPVFGRIPVNIEKYQLVPPLESDTFLIFAGQITRNGQQQAVFEIREPFSNADRQVLKVGDKYNTITNGNWK
jgi:hypothetical protein